MKRALLRALLIVAVVLFLAGPVGADDTIPQPKIRSFVSVGYVFPLGGAAYTGIEYPLYSWTIGDTAVVSLGVAAAAQFAYAVWRDTWSYATLGAAFLGTATISFPGEGERPLRDRLLISFVPGFGINVYFYAGDPSYYTNRDEVQPGFAGFGSVRYRISNTFAAGVDLVYWGRYIGPNLGLGFQFALN